MCVIWLDDMIFTLNVYVLGKIYLKIIKKTCKAPLWFAKFLPEPYNELFWKPLHSCCLSLHWALSNCCDPWKNSFHAFMIKIYVHTIYPLAMLPWEVSIVPHFTSHKIKTPHYVIEVSLSIFCYKRDMGYKKRSEKMDTWRSKHTKKGLDTWRSMKKIDKKER